MKIVSILSRSGICLISICNWALGTLILVYIIWTLNTADNFHLITNGKSIITITELVFGLLISIKGLLGIFGACQKQECLLKFFLFLAIMTVSVEVGTFISLKVTNVKISDLVEQNWKEANLNTRNYVQRELKCCGLTGLSEFASKLDPIDESCYPKWDNFVNKQPFRVGCKDKLVDWVHTSKSRLISTMCTLVVFQVISILLVLIELRHGKSVDHGPNQYNEEMLLTQRSID